MSENKIYLGDSVYCQFDGFGYTLTTENGHIEDPSNSIYLEPMGIHNLTAFHKEMQMVKSGVVPDEQ